LAASLSSSRVRTCSSGTVPVKVVLMRMVPMSETIRSGGYSREG
jgi:hypothetical protein